MKSFKSPSAITSLCIVSGILSLLFFTGCKKLAGLPLQQNAEHETTVIDPHINESAWAFLKERALGTSSYKDSIFYLMYLAVLYSGIDTAEYTKINRTFIFLHKDAINRKSGNITTPDCYFGKYKVDSPPVPAKDWGKYPKEKVKNYLLSLIVEGDHTFENISTDAEFDQTLMPLNSDSLNPQSLISFRVTNDRDSKIRINDFPGSDFPAPGLTTPGLQVRTGGILATNGTIHVVDRVVFFQRH